MSRSIATRLPTLYHSTWEVQPPPPLCRGAAAADGEHLQAALQGGLADVAADKAVAAKDDQAGSAVIRL